ncbi:MAG: D-glycerate dehydrogenase [Sphingomonadaceae bacterium]
MATIIATTRPLPLPEMELAGRQVRFVHAEAGAVPDGAVALLSTAVDPVDAALISTLPDSVGLIANLGVGYDNIDLAAAAARGLLVSNTPVVTEDTADLAFALILAACRRVGQGERFLRAGKWNETGTPPLGTRVHGAKLGIIGFGAIGQAVARRASGFGMTVLYHNRSRKPVQANALSARYCKDLAELLAAADIVSIHAPLTEETRHLIDADALAACKPGAVLVNTARGPLVDEDALIAALETGHIAAAGLDVFSEEPSFPEALLAMEQVVLTPHIGSATAQCRTDMVQRGIANIAQFLETGTIRDMVPLGRE